MNIENILKQIPIGEIAIIIRIEKERIKNKLDLLLDNKFEIIREAGMMVKEYPDDDPNDEYDEDKEIDEYEKRKDNFIDRNTYNDNDDINR